MDGLPDAVVDSAVFDADPEAGVTKFLEYYEWTGYPGDPLDVVMMSQGTKEQRREFEEMGERYGTCC
jgi:hypothetical protein